MTIVGVSYTLRLPADGSIGVSTTIGTMDVALQTDPARGNNLPPPFPGATLVGSPGADVTVGAFTLIANTPVVGGGGSVVGDFVATVPTLAAHTTYSVSLLTHAGCPQTIGSFTTL
jgi:hypothetical protein